MASKDRFAHLPPSPDQRHADDAWKYDPVDLARHEAQLQGIIAAIRERENGRLTVPPFGHVDSLHAFA